MESGAWEPARARPTGADNVLILWSSRPCWQTHAWNFQFYALIKDLCWKTRAAKGVISDISPFKLFQILPHCLPCMSSTMILYSGQGRNCWPHFRTQRTEARRDGGLLTLTKPVPNSVHELDPLFFCLVHGDLFPQPGSPGIHLRIVSGRWK